MTNAPAGTIALYAITDTHLKQTFLLPDYFKLSLQDQEAILFHEAYWLMHPDAPYPEVVAAEISFQAVLDKPSDPLRILNFMDGYAPAAAQFLYALNADLASGALNGLVNAQGETTMGDLLGRDYLECGSQATNCKPYLVLHLNQLASQFPKS